MFHPHRLGRPRFGKAVRNTLERRGFGHAANLLRFFAQSIPGEITIETLGS
jgi:hypothetical protein